MSYAKWALKKPDWYGKQSGWDEPGIPTCAVAGNPGGLPPFNLVLFFTITGMINSTVSGVVMGHDKWDNYYYNRTFYSFEIWEPKIPSYV